MTEHGEQRGKRRTTERRRRRGVPAALGALEGAVRAVRAVRDVAEYLSGGGRVEPVAVPVPVRAPRPPARDR